jgi:anti-sigma factor RsiW
MHEDMHNLLNAYLDGELHGMRLLEMKNHLASCAQCRQELKDLRQVSDLIQAAPAPAFMPAERFAANLGLKLPRRSLRDRPPKPGSLAWWLVPAGLLSAWFFVRTLFALTSFITLADSTGLLGSSAGWLNSAQQAGWYEPAMSLFGAVPAETLPTVSALNEVSVFGFNLLSGFFLQAVIILLYWGWLVVWWRWRGPRPMKSPAIASQS